MQLIRARELSPKTGAVAAPFACYRHSATLLRTRTGSPFGCRAGAAHAWRGAHSSVDLLSERRHRWDQRRSPSVHGLDDLSGVDPLQVDGGDAEVGVAKLALDHIQRDALARDLHGVGVAE